MRSPGRASHLAQQPAETRLDAMPIGPAAASLPKEIDMSETTKQPATEPSHTDGRTPPAWLISAAMFAFAVVTIVLVVTGQ
jgi:hypothetical protein